MRMVFWSGAAFYNSVPNLFAEIRLRFCGNKFEIYKNAGFGGMARNSASVENASGGHPPARC